MTEGASEPPRRRPLLAVLVGLAVLAVIAAVVAWQLGWLGGGQKLPQAVGTYTRVQANPKLTGNLLDSATYRAAPGDLYQAVLMKNQPEPSRAYNAAAEATRFKIDNVYCTGANKSAAGGRCAYKLKGGATVVVTGSTKHPVKDIADFANSLQQALGG